MQTTKVVTTNSITGITGEGMIAAIPPAAVVLAPLFFIVTASEDFTLSKENLG